MHHVPRQLVLAHEHLAAAEAAGGVFHRGKRLGQDLLQRGLLVGRGSDPLAKLRGLGTQLLVGQRLVGDFQFVDARDGRPGLLKELLVVPAGKTFEEKREHEEAAA